MTQLILQAAPLTDDAFAPFGQVIQCHDHDALSINGGRTHKYADLARVDTVKQGGRTAVHLYRSEAIALPFSVESLEYHPLGSQAFMPLHDRPFPVVVAPASDHIDPDGIRLFVTNGRQGVNLDAGTWHHYQITVGEPASYLVIDRQGPGGNCIEQQLQFPCLINTLIA